VGKVAQSSTNYCQLEPKKSLYISFSGTKNPRIGIIPPGRQNKREQFFIAYPPFLHPIMMTKMPKRKQKREWRETDDESSCRGQKGESGRREGQGEMMTSPHVKVWEGNDTQRVGKGRNRKPNQVLATLQTTV
jgi:hypothetical protein